jgi:formamidopyrimidine-DNA glycosylase
MPELPEVELISRSLDALVRGKRVIEAELLRERLAPHTGTEEFSRSLRSASINFIHRRGKHILFDLSNHKTLIVHLRMSGRFSLLDAEDENPKFTHAILYFDDELRLVFDDQRHFGYMRIVPTADLFMTRELAKLAPEPFSDEFSFEYLRQTLRSSRRSLKEVLVDQTKVCGLGNIYACEAMFAAGINPKVPAARLSKKRSARLYDSIRAVLDLALSHAAGLDVDPTNLEGGYFSAGSTNGWFVYDRETEPCKICSTSIVRLKQGGRSTYYCKTCQRR